MQYDDIDDALQQTTPFDFVSSILLDELDDAENRKPLVFHITRLYLRWARSNIYVIRNNPSDKTKVQDPDYCSQLVLFCAEHGINLFQSSVLREMVRYTEELRLARAKGLEGRLYKNHYRENPKCYWKDKSLEPAFYELSELMQTKTKRDAVQHIFKKYPLIRREGFEDKYKFWKKYIHFTSLKK